MENFVSIRLQKVLCLLIKNRRRIEKENRKIEKLQRKIQVSQTKLNKLKTREESLRDKYDLYYEADYYDVDQNKIRFKNEHNRKIYDDQFKTEEEKRRPRVKLPDIFEDI